MISFGVAAVCGGPVPAVADVARACEESGFQMLLFPEHSHVPEGPQLRRPAGPPVSRAYIDLLDSIVATAVALGATQRLRAGPGVALLAQRDPIYFAKEIASLDVISGGRVVVGVGAGWNAMELQNHGIDEQRRRSVFEARLALVRALLTGDPRALEWIGAVGDGVSDARDVFGPPPVQVPCPPFMIGGESRGSVQLAARYGLRWMPSCADAQRLLAQIRRVRDGEYGEAARDLSITVFAPPLDHELFERFAALGVDQLVLRLDPADADTVRRVGAIVHPG
jgi:alkanesulfonate monooxygenase SsuD/methylene tetrahydromethanopterin reductase-like flavin-dependent oxidoreductase (luciferase family)